MAILNGKRYRWYTDPATLHQRRKWPYLDEVDGYPAGFIDSDEPYDVSTAKRHDLKLRVMVYDYSQLPRRTRKATREFKDLASAKKELERLVLAYTNYAYKG